MNSENFSNSSNIPSVQDTLPGPRYASGSNRPGCAGRSRICWSYEAPAKNLSSMGFEGGNILFDLHPLAWKNPPDRTISRLKSLFHKRVVFQKGGFGGCPPERKPEQKYTHMFAGTKTEMRVHSPKPPFYETALLSPLDQIEKVNIFTPSSFPMSSLESESFKRPDVHKIVLSIKSRSPPPGKSVNFEDFLLIYTVFPHFGPFGGGGLTKFCGQEFHGHPDFSNWKG